MPNSRAREFLVYHESLRLLVYDDATGKPLVPGMILQGHPTIGYGRALDTHGISILEANRMLDADINLAELLAESLPWYLRLDQCRRDVVVMMIFNLGFGGFREFKLLIRAIDAGRFAEAATEMLNSQWALQVGRRARELASMMSTGAYPLTKSG